MVAHLGIDKLNDPWAWGGMRIPLDGVFPPCQLSLFPRLPTSCSSSQGLVEI